VDEEPDLEGDAERSAEEKRERGMLVKVGI
jgi:hypothetical protein